MSYFKLISTDVLRNRLWDFFLSFNKNNNKKNLNEILRSCIDDDICDQIIKKKIIYHQINIGGFGGIYDIKIMIKEKQQQEDIYSINVSINPAGGFEPFYMKCLMKLNINLIDLNCIFNKNIIFIEEPFSEVVFSSFLNNIFDIGLCPFISKNLGFFSCTNQLLQLTEKCDGDIFGLMNSNPDFFSGTNSKNIIFQILYSLYILKKNLGFVHYDLHLKNILYKTNNNIYKGTDINDKKYFILQTHHSNKFIILKNLKMISKLNDFGQCTFFMNDSTTYLKQNIILSSNYDTILLGNGKSAIKNCLESKSYRITCDVMYILLNFWEVFRKFYCITELDSFENMDKSKIKFKDSIVMLEKFFKNFFNNTIDIDKFISEKNCHLRSFPPRLKFLIGTRDVGLKNNSMFEDCSSILDGLIRCCEYYKKIGDKEYYFFEKIDSLEDDIIYLSSEPTIFEKKYNNFYNYINTHNEIFSSENVLAKKIITHIDEEIILKLKLETDDKLNIFRNNKMFNTITINNSIIGDINLNRKGSFIKQKYQNWFNNKSINNEDIGKSLEVLFFHIFNVNNLLPFVSYKKNITEAQSFYNSLISISAGCFIVPGNINILTSHLITKDNINDPLGFFYIKGNKNNGTVLSYPSVYENDTAVVYCVKNRIFLDKFKNFKNKHKLIPYKEKYLNFYNNNIIENDYNCISMANSENPSLQSRLGEYPILFNNKRITDEYDWAFETGPILIFDSKIVFDSNKLMEISKIKDIVVKTLTDSKTPYKFFCENNEKNFYYNMRHSNKYMIHNIIFETNNNEIGFLLSEGRGFDSPGIDRIQLTYFLNFFNIKTAVSLDGGFSACAKFLNKFVFATPENRKLPMVFSFKERYEKMDLD